VREAKRVQRPHINAQAHAYCSSMRGRAGRHSSSARTGVAVACLRADKSCMHTLWGPSRQSGRQRHDARIPSIGRMRPWKCVVCTISCHIHM
jgi:hypothetical protein